MAYIFISQSLLIDFGILELKISRIIFGILELKDQEQGLCNIFLKQSLKAKQCKFILSFFHFLFSIYNIFVQFFLEKLIYKKKEDLQEDQFSIKLQTYYDANPQQKLFTNLTVFHLICIKWDSKVIKIRLQLQQALIEKKDLQNPYTGTINCFSRLYKEEGFKNYYKGNFTNVIRYFPTQAFNFAFKLFYSKIFTYNKSKAQFWQGLFYNTLYGSAAGASTQFFIYPFEYVQTRLTNDFQLAHSKRQRQFIGIADCINKTIKSDGMRGIYRGFVVSCIFMMAYRGSYFGLNDSIKPLVQQQILHNMFYNFLIGYGVTVVSGFISYPLDTVRRRMMMSSGQRFKFTSSGQCISHLYKNHGLRSFYGGVGANMIRCVTGAGVLTIYDKLQLQIYGKKYTN